MQTLSDLPLCTELWVQIFEWLDKPEDTVNFALVCKAFQTIAEDSTSMNSLRISKTIPFVKRFINTWVDSNELEKYPSKKFNKRNGLQEHGYRVTVVGRFQCNHMSSSYNYTLVKIFHVSTKQPLFTFSVKDTIVEQEDRLKFKLDPDNEQGNFLAIRLEKGGWLYFAPPRTFIEKMIEIAQDFFSQFCMRSDNAPHPSARNAFIFSHEI